MVLCGSRKAVEFRKFFSVSATADDGDFTLSVHSLYEYNNPQMQI